MAMEAKVRNYIRLNYYTIRAMFDFVNGHVTSKVDENDDMYDLLEISKSSYDKLVYSGTGVKRLGERVAEWSRLTGIEKNIFIGNTLFNFRDEQLNQKIVHAILIPEHEGADIEDDDYKDIRNEIRKHLSHAPHNIQDKNLLACYNFARYRGGITTRVQAVQKVGNIYRTIDTITLNELKLLTAEELEGYSIKLEKASNLVNALILIKKEENSNVTK